MTEHPMKQSRQESREARIETLRRQIAAGTYSISSSELANALIEHMQQKQRRAA